ncbi:hypothetical protein PHLGIDRAFT_82347 [Phlebiopsis gigantea 11061_1 CR5-6]|uniref:Ribophorin II n=1 Tax=Phlebiopsis gigantea (strain 11061_1 CR5-6) TaxID=745531 RepID=A0A0C3S705_PHLG1|nr:hypothetical protein PHLGIDRAFT_82347 [Phlebiopsis gigantea 11061_1 CR5-6]
MGLATLCLFSLAAVGQVLAGQLTVQSPRLSVIGKDASIVRSEPISLAAVNKAAPVHLDSTETLKLAFTVVAKDKDPNVESKNVQPHQTFVRFYEKLSGEEGVVPVRVTQNGKAKFELNLARPPAALPPTPLVQNKTNPLSVSLLLGSYSHSPFKLELFDLYLPPSQPAPEHPDEKTFHPQPEIQHTFRPAEKLPNRVISGVGALLVAGGPWILLLGLLSHITISLPYATSISILPFTLSLAAFEGLLVWYWADLKLGEVLAYGAILGLITAVTGKTALSKRGAWRVQGAQRK